jgi:predicted outer membrane protein
MKKKLSISVAILLFVAVLSCGSKKETAASIAQKWCDLNAKVHKAADGGSEYEAAKMARKKFENEIDAKYKDNKVFRDEVGKEVEKCEAASEGR